MNDRPLWFLVAVISGISAVLYIGVTGIIFIFSTLPLWLAIGIVVVILVVSVVMAWKLMTQA